MVNDKQAYYEHLNESVRQFEEPFFDKLVYKTCLCLSVYTTQIITVEKMKKSCHMKQKVPTKHIDEICLTPLLLINVWPLFLTVYNCL